MKKNIIISFILIVIAITALVTYQYISSFRQINFLIKQSNVTVDIYKTGNDDQKLSTLTSDGAVSLQNGDYYYVASGEKVDTVNHLFKVTPSTKTIEIDPDYSSSYLSGVLVDESSSIQAVISSTYPTLITQYDTFDQKLFKKGQWYGGLLRNRIDNQDGFKDTYRIILHKENNKWVIVHYPEIVVTKANFSNVPIDVLTSVNKLLDS